MRTREICLLVLINVLWAIASMVQPNALAKGRVEYHQIRSDFMAAVGDIAERGLSVYLPEEYDTSELAYPVLYLLHGAWGLMCPAMVCSSVDVIPQIIQNIMSI